MPSAMIVIWAGSVALWAPDCLVGRRLAAGVVTVVAGSWHTIKDRRALISIGKTRFTKLTVAIHAIWTWGAAFGVGISKACATVVVGIFAVVSWL